MQRYLALAMANVMSIPMLVRCFKIKQNTLTKNTASDAVSLGMVVNQDNSTNKFYSYVSEKLFEFYKDIIAQPKIVKSYNFSSDMVENSI